jgi:Flp pilus assembly protein TadD
MTHRPLAMLVSTALAAGLLAGCAQGGPRPDQTASRAESSLSGGDATKAVALAEQAVLADPRNPGYRMLLGSAYMRAGRFESARQAYDEAMELGDDSGKVALSLALTDMALGHEAVALDTLEAHRDQIPVADYGLALAMVGRADQAVDLLTQAIRSGEGTPKLRQNLAYAMAMAGHWREARDMASQDVPADQLTARMAQWAQLNDPDNMRLRVAGLLGVPMREDTGQPAALALANFPAPGAQASGEQAPVRQADSQGAAPSQKAPALARFAAQELPAIDQADHGQPDLADASSAPGRKAGRDRHAAPAARRPSPALAHGSPRRNPPRPRFAPEPRLARAIPPAMVARTAQAQAAKMRQARLEAPRETPRTGIPAGTPMIQLGAFSTQEGAHRAWRHYLAANPALKDYRPVITSAVVNGKQYWRTQAAGFASATPARSLCGSVKARGGVCLVMASPIASPATGPATGGAPIPKPSVSPATVAEATVQTTRNGKLFPARPNRALQSARLAATQQGLSRGRPGPVMQDFVAMGAFRCGEPDRKFGSS